MWGRGLKMNVFCIFFDFQLKIHSLKIYSWVSGVSPAGGGGGVLPYKSDEGARRKISRTSLKGTRIFFFYWRVPNSFAPLRGTNSTTNYITGTANFNGNKDNF